MAAAIGDETKIGAFVEIQKNATIGRRCKISSHTFICEGVTIEDHVFIGHGVMFINDSYPRATTASGELQTAQDWTVEADVGAGRRFDRFGRHDSLRTSLSANSAIVGAGSVVTRDVPARCRRRRKPRASVAHADQRTRELGMMSNDVQIL